MIKDKYGNLLTGATCEGVAHYERALHELQCFVADPVASVDQALQTNPGFTMAHVLKGYLHLLGTEPLAISTAKVCQEAAAKLGGTEQERGHIAAVGHLVAGRWHAAGRTLEDVSIEHPHDILALQAGHQIDFFTGNARMLRDRIARAMPMWKTGMPSHHAMMGMYAFGLEEMADYTAAETHGRRAVEMEPRDTWAQHAVAHVMEMQGRHRDGITWMRANQDGWARDSFFAVHNWWHLALYHLDRGEIDAVLDLFDGSIYGKKSPVVLDMIDASALLWRLRLRGIDVGGRWEALADNWTPIATAGNYAFNDVHAMMAFVGAGRTAMVTAVMQAQAEAMAANGDNAMFTRDVGHPVAKAILAFGEGNYGETVTALRPVRGIASRFGGSHAQRDLLDLTMIEAALRSGDKALAMALAAERMAMKPGSPLARLFMQRAEAASPLAA
jgi:hypothetical protein